MVTLAWQVSKHWQTLKVKRQVKTCPACGVSCLCLKGGGEGGVRLYVDSAILIASVETKPWFRGIEGVAWVGLAKDWILFLMLNCSVSPCGKLS